MREKAGRTGSLRQCSRISGREGKMKKWILLLWIIPIFVISCVTGSSERKKDNCPSGVPASGSQK
jgi:hypothetical protein